VEKVLNLLYGFNEVNKPRNIYVLFSPGLANMQPLREVFATLGYLIGFSNII
jgi:hypothetical protein